MLVYEEKDIGWFTHIEESASGRFCIIAGGDHDTSEEWLIDLSDAGRRAAPDRAARDGRALQRGRSRRRALHPHQRGWRHRFPHRHRAARRARARATGASWSRTGRAPTSSTSISIAGHLVRLERANALPSIVIRDLAQRRRAHIAFDEAAYSLDMVGRLRVRHDDIALRLLVDDDAGRGLRLRHGDAGSATLRKRQEIPSGHDPAAYVTTRIMATVARRRRGAGLDPASPRPRARRQRAAAALRLRLLRHGDAGLLLGQPPVAGRSRLRLCHRPYPRRLRQGLVAGISTASARRKPTRSTTSSPPAAP